VAEAVYRLKKEAENRHYPGEVLPIGMVFVLMVERDGVLLFEDAEKRGTAHGSRCRRYLAIPKDKLGEWLV